MERTDERHYSKDQTQGDIEKACLGIEDSDDAMALGNLLARTSNNVNA